MNAESQILKIGIFPYEGALIGRAKTTKYRPSIPEEFQLRALEVNQVSPQNSAFPIEL
jgi:hypothetical protein